MSQSINCKQMLEKLNEISDHLLEMSSNDSSETLSIESTDFRPNLINMYESKQFTDFEFIIGHNSDRRPVHRLILTLNKCQLFTQINNENIDSITLTDVKTESFDLLMNHFYSQNDIKLNKNNVKDIIELSKRLKNLELLIKCYFFEWKLNAIQIKNDFKDIDFNSNQINYNQKSVETEDNNNNNISSTQRPKVVNKWKPVLDSEPLDTSKRMRLSENEDKNDVEFNRNENSMDSSLNSVKMIAEDMKESTDEERVSFDYKICQLIKCHKRDPKLTIDNDINVNVWKSVFIPQDFNKKKEQMIATVGGYVSAHIDCEQFIQTRENIFDSTLNEELFSIAVTQLPVKVNEEIKDWSYVFAIGGELNIYLCLDSKFNQSYDMIKGFEDPVQALVFDNNNPNRLFSSSAKTIIIWKIGSLYSENGVIQHTQNQSIYQFKYEKCDFTSLCFISEKDCLIACGESTDIIFFKDISTLKPIIGKTMLKIAGNKINTITDLAYIENTKLIVIRTPFLDYLIIADLDAMLNKLIDSFEKRRTGFDGKQAINVLFVKWTELIHSKPFGTGYIFLAVSNGIIACGDDYGNVFLYDSNQIVQNKPLEPIKVLEWPANDQPARILSVSISNDAKYMVSTTSNNLVCIWKNYIELDST